MGDVPFSAYDFFGYLACGALVVLLGDYLYGPQLLLAASHDFLDYAILLVAAYSVGHLISHIAERTLQGYVFRFLGAPSKILMNQATAPGTIRARLFGSYFSPLPEFIRNRITTKIQNSTGETLTGEALFLFIFSSVESTDHVRAKLNSMLNLYGFARNMSLASFIGGLFSLIGPLDHRNADLIEWSILFFVMAIIFFYRYLKFFKHYSQTAFVAYSAP